MRNENENIIPARLLKDPQKKMGELMEVQTELRQRLKVVGNRSAPLYDELEKGNIRRRMMRNRSGYCGLRALNTVLRNTRND